MNNARSAQELQVEFYERVYPRLTSEGSQGRFHRLTHRLLESPYPTGTSFPRVLEVGAGSGEHLPFVRHDFEDYVMSDVRDLVSSARDPRVRFVQTGAEDLPFGDETFDRVLATCLLHHLADPISALEEWRRVTRPAGVISIMIPADPGALYRVAWAATSARNMRSLGFQHGSTLHAIEHRNHAGSLHNMIEWVFRGDSLTSRGFPMRPARWWNLNLLAVYHAVRR